MLSGCWGLRNVLIRKHSCVESNPFNAQSRRSVMDTIREKIGRSTPPLLSFLSPQQGDAIKAAVDESSDLIVVLPTVDGKTLVYQTPCLNPRSSAELSVKRSMATGTWHFLCL